MYDTALPFRSFMSEKDYNRMVFRLYNRQHEITIKKLPKRYKNLLGSITTFTLPLYFPHRRLQPVHLKMPCQS